MQIPALAKIDCGFLGCTPHLNFPGKPQQAAAPRGLPALAVRQPIASECRDCMAPSRICQSLSALATRPPTPARWLTAWLPPTPLSKFVAHGTLRCISSWPVRSRYMAESSAPSSGRTTLRVLNHAECLTKCEDGSAPYGLPLPLKLKLWVAVCAAAQTVGWLPKSVCHAHSTCAYKETHRWIFKPDGAQLGPLCTGTRQRSCWLLCSRSPGMHHLKVSWPAVHQGGSRPGKRAHMCAQARLHPRQPACSSHSDPVAACDHPKRSPGRPLTHTCVGRCGGATHPGRPLTHTCVLPCFPMSPICYTLEFPVPCPLASCAHSTGSRLAVALGCEQTGTCVCVCVCV